MGRKGRVWEEGKRCREEGGRECGDEGERYEK